MPEKTLTQTPITISYGDGIGPEIMKATLGILEAAGAPLEYEEIQIGQAVYERGITSGIEPSAWDSLRRTRVFLKAPITTPQGKGYKSLNVTTRKRLGLFANVRPCTSYHPFVPTKHPSMDVVIIRENEEDTYAGIEHRQTREVYQCLKLISAPGSEKIVRYAFEYARAYGREKVACFTKDNIMKMTDGAFHAAFDRIGEEYPDIEKDHYIIDIGTARLADTPEIFDVIVTPNLYGDVISDVAAQIAGSVGLCGSINLGEHCAMFEAIHGSAPDIAGEGIANPSGLLHAAILMLHHLGQNETAAKIHNAWLTTLEDGIHTGDIYTAERSRERVNTQEFGAAVIERFGQSPKQLPSVTAQGGRTPKLGSTPTAGSVTKKLVGVDVFIDWSAADRDPDRLASQLQSAETDQLRLKIITNRGVTVWPDGFPETFCTDHWRCRFVAKGDSLKPRDLVDLVASIDQVGLEFIKTEHLYEFDGALGYSLAQGE